MKVLAFDVGGTTIKGGLVDEKLKIQDKFIEAVSYTHLTLPTSVPV